MILHISRMRRNVNRNVFNDRKNVSATTATESATRVTLSPAVISSVLVPGQMSKRHNAQRGQIVSPSVYRKRSTVHICRSPSNSVV